MWGDLYGDTKEWMDLVHMRPAMTKHCQKGRYNSGLQEGFFIFLINLLIF